MRKLVNVLCLCGIVLLNTSCKTYTAVSVDKIQPYGIIQKEPKMDFIGFKNMSKYNEIIANFSSDLQNLQIAEDRTKFYLGHYDLQELSAYSGNHRYISFIDVIKQRYTHSDRVDDNYDMELAGWLIGGLTCFTLVPVYVPLMCCYKGNTTEIVIDVEYNIYVYDTKKNEVVKVESVIINQKERLDGRYSHKNTNVKEVNTHYKTIISNKLLEAYEKIYNEL